MASSGEFAFDPTAKKKKRTKKSSDADKTADAVPPPAAAAPAKGAAAAAPAKVSFSDASGDSLELPAKKKKSSASKAAAVAAAAAAAAADSDSEEEDKPKKKSSIKKPTDDVELVDFDDSTARPEAVAAAPVVEPWHGSDRDYNYAELLGRVFQVLRNANKEITGEKTRIYMKPPDVWKEGTKKVVFANFQQTCAAVHRNADHVLAFMLAELGTSGSLDGSGRLVMKGRFAPKSIEKIIRRYVVEYVVCKVCKSPDTVLTKENRLYFLQCGHCGASRSVAAIKAGFQAQIGKRKKTG
eukprot:gnl/Hemi2/20979_TR6958_c0_g5_i1.p1 gnl/Hemi2/20979_TR6958_c0_g5~~gnl/Hemi2/20979_TR6958_c0_g5_i1.p1  ORF type:complete len:314 (-),score=123.69 gnl/Hemi2/20979_TR6958_c0_g5_i1:64-954(-)